MYIKPLAVKITQDTYSIAVACLGGGFASYPYPEVEGCYLVINVPTPEYGRVRRFGHEAANHSIVLGNKWMTQDQFRAEYTWDGRKSQENFFEAKRVATIKPKPELQVDEVGDKIRELYEAHFGESED